MLRSRSYAIRKTDQFERWLLGLQDVAGRARILARMSRLAHGHTGDSRHLGGGVWELRIHVGPGYRVYFNRPEAGTIVLLIAGSKSTQERDIARARAMAAFLHGEDQ